MDERAIINTAQAVLKMEAEAVMGLIEKIDKNFIRAVELILECKGKVVIIGIGKSGIIGRKIASTFASTGVSAIFLHPVEGMHGDLGMVSKDDVAIVISNSGETSEISQMVPVLRRIAVPFIVITGNSQSSLAKSGDVVLDVSVKEEAGPLGLVPTSSSTATLAMGDALVIALLEKRGFNEEDYALLHPGGIIGRKLLLRVEDIMHTGEEIPLVNESTLMKEALFEITSKGLGITGVKDKNGKLVGVITDGDLRRALEHGANMLNMRASEVMTKEPKTIGKAVLAGKALSEMEKYSITSLFVCSDNKGLVGVVHIHDILKPGVT
ncbi:MAG: KpsF/GutQ family sugar-phosphate isomerase [Thermodesulfobacteriota bacterium]|nr:KpsF/GutQ family sugar-phosphate isomerase [Thermodesulfobacteriota bacterium]